MTKVCKQQFPMGSFPKQQSDGFHMPEYLCENISIYAKKIADDMQFLGVLSSSTFEVRTGKSTLAQQIGSFYTEKVNELHKTDIEFTDKNIVFSYKELMDRAMELPPMSCLILDEGDDLAEHFASKIAKELRKFFRKSGQLNLFIIIIMPDFFELPKNYAITRSNFLIDVKFENDFERGFFEFYSFKKKKWLYIKGKKYQDWTVEEPSFKGRFLGLYTVNKEIYLRRKKEDLKKYDDDEKGEGRLVKRYKNRIRILMKIITSGFLKTAELAKRMTEAGDKMDRTLITKIIDNNASEV